MFADLKPLAYLAIITAIISSYGAVWLAGKEAGANETLVEQQGKANERVETITAEFTVKIKKANDAAKSFENKLIKLQSEKPKEVTVYVEKIKTLNPDCRNINGFSELWNGIRANYQPQ